MSEQILRGINKLRPWVLGICLTAVVKLVTLQTQSIVREELREFISRAEYSNSLRRLEKLEQVEVQTHDNTVVLAKLQEDVTWIREALVHYKSQGALKEWIGPNPNLGVNK